MNDAACHDTDPNVFFPAPGSGRNANAEVAQAKAICKDCPVRITCLEYALDNHIDHGVWGGISERGRKALRAGRRLALVDARDVA
jgi:WhiB family redox-sensing transcriptional regulator